MNNQNPQFVNSYFSDLLYYHSFSDKIWNYDAAELQAFEMFRNSEIFAPSIPTMTPDGSFNTPIKNVQSVEGIILTATQNGTGLDIVFTDATLAIFRVGQKVNDANFFEAIVTASAPGTMSIAPLNNPTTLTAGTHFKANSITRAVGKIAASFNSVGTTTLYDTKDVQTDWTEITRESAQIARMEKMNLFAADAPTGEKVFYGYQQTEADTFNRFVWQCVYKYMFGKGGTGINLPDGTASKTYGIRNRIIDDSGNYISGVAPITQGQFEAILEKCVTVNPNFGQEIYVFPGWRAAKQISSFYPTQLGFVGGQRQGNTVSISLDVREVYVAGTLFKIVLNFGLLNSNKIQDWNKDSVYFLNMSPTMMNGKSAKLVQLIHSSNDPASTQTVLRRETPGMTGSGSGDSTGLGNIGQNQVTVSSVDGTSIEFLDHSGIAMVAKGHGLFEFPH